jgi:hypothetical protein
MKVMNNTKQLIGYFENLAKNAYNCNTSSDLFNNQSDEIKKIIFEKNSNKLRSYFNKSHYFADSIKVVDIQ